MLVVTVVLQIVRIVNKIHRFVTKLSFNLWHRIVVVVIDVLGGVRVVVLLQVRMVVLDPVIWNQSVWIGVESIKVWIGCKVLMVLLGPVVRIGINVNFYTIAMHCHLRHNAMVMRISNIMIKDLSDRQHLMMMMMMLHRI